MKKIRSLGAAIVAAAALGLAAAPAQAEIYVAACLVSSPASTECLVTPGAEAARARYSDDSNAMCSIDTLANGKSAVAVIWKKGNPDDKRRIWAHGGEGNIVCEDLGGKRENAEWVMRSCLGEWAPAPANRRVTSCGPPRPFYI